MNATARVVFQPNGRHSDILVGVTLLEAARRMGVEIESICGGRQTCGKCKVYVEEGDFAKFGLVSRGSHLSPPDGREAEYARKDGFAPNARLSCACVVEGDLVIRVPEESQVRKQIVRKAAGIERPITVDAPMRLYYVELPPADLRDHRGDWERLQGELFAVHGLDHLQIDLDALRGLQAALAAHGRCVTVTIWDKQEVVRVQPGLHDELYGMAVDVGTTTVAGHLCQLRTGEVLATASCMNPQVPYGEDLMSRISYAMTHQEGTQHLHRLIIDAINGLIAQACGEAEVLPTDVVELVAVGNTTMHHLLLGMNPRELGGTPFSLATHSALDVKARDLGITIAAGGHVHVPACEAGHVGADNVAVLVAETPYAQDDQMLVIDVGTNGELLLGNRQQVLSASSPTGPAFEGAQISHGMRAADGAIDRVRIDPATLAVRYKIIGKGEWIDSIEPSDDGTDLDGVTGDGVEASRLRQAQRRHQREDILHPRLRATGICGSGIIEAVAELYLAGLIGANGRFIQIDHPRMRPSLHSRGKAEFVLAWAHETNTGRDIVVHSDDVRAVQLAKAALYAGAKLLMHRMQLNRVDRIVLAGGFGSYIDPKHAMVLGLIPDCDLTKVQSVGNAAGDGARMILLDRQKRTEATWAARWTTYVETAAEPSFQDEFVAAIPLPHASDLFPHIQPIVDEARRQWSADRKVAVELLDGPRRARRVHGQE